MNQSAPVVLWQEVPSIPFVDYPDRFADVLAERAYWKHEPIELVGPLDAGGVRYVRNYEMPLDAGQGAWRRHDPVHPRCWYCGKFTSPKWRGKYEPPCRDCGEATWRPW